MTRRRANGRERIAFGPFTLDPIEGRLWRGVEHVPLRRKAWEVLSYLVTRPHTLVSNDELLSRGWPGIAVTPQTLTNVIRELRLALQDSAKAPRFIETVHRRGYVFHLAGAASEPTGAGVPTTAATPLVGRERELAHLRTMWQRAQAGASRVVFLSGEPGIGKTALADALAEAVAHDGSGRIARGPCIEYHGALEAYLPLLAAIESLAAGPDGRRVRARLARYAPTWLLQLPWRLDAEERRRLAHSLHDTTGARMLREGIALVAALAGDAPLVLLVEDLHWSDRATLDWIGAIARRPLAQPLLILATYRPVDATRRAHPVVALARDLVHAGHAGELALEPFGPAAVGQYLLARCGAGAVDPGIVERFAHRSAGSPLFLRSLVDELLARRALASPDDGWRLAEQADALLRDFPPSLREFVLRALDELTPAQRLVVEVASVAGLDAAPARIARAAGVDVLEAEAACADLARVGRLLRRAPQGAGQDVAAYAFVHAAYREVVYEQIAPLRRGTLHRAVGLALEDGGDAPAVPAVHLAAHFEHAAMAERAAQYYERAADAAAQRFAHRESVTYLRTALAQLERARHGESAAAAHLHWRLGTTLPFVLGYAAPESGEAFARAQAIFAACDEAVGVFVSAAGLCRYALARGEIGAARMHADRLLAMIETVPAGLRALGCLWAGFTASARGELAQARHLLAQGAAAPDDAHLTGDHDNHRVIASQLALVLTVTGNRAGAQRQAARALAQAQAGGRLSDLAHAWLLETERCAMGGDAATGRAAAARATALAKENAFVSFLAFGHFYEALFDHATPAAERIDAMRASMADRHALGDRWHDSMLLGLLAGVQLAGGDRRGALDSLECAEAHVERTGEAHYRAELQRLRGECLLADGDRSQAASWFDRAAATARAQGARLYERRAQARLARSA